MDFQRLYDFLDNLNTNNYKEWMNLNRSEYHQIRDEYIEWLDGLNDILSKIDPQYFNTPGKKAINRINNNLLFHPNRPIYKDHIGAGLDQKTKQGDFYIEIGLQQNLLAGGYWRPKKETLDCIRKGIDYNGDELRMILERDSFKKIFGGLYQDQILVNAPKSFSKDHPHIELLKNKTFAVEVTLSRKRVLSPDFKDYIIEVYKEMLPFRRYLRQAASVA